MKKVFLSAAFLMCSTLIFAQKYETSYFGLKLGMNSSTNSLEPNISGVSTDYKNGFAGGIYYNFGVSRLFSVQPELLYSQMGSKVNKTTTPTSNGEMDLTYLSIPILLKITPHWRFGLFAGPQLDILASSKATTGDQSPVDQKEYFKGGDFAWTAGAEIWLTKNIGVYGRYIGGLSNINNLSGSNLMLPINPPVTSPFVDEINNNGWQVGLTIGIRKKVPAPVVVVPVVPVVVDTDADGIPDNVDKCPTLPGVSKYNGCPIPDTDRDGINDDNDKCPTVPGFAKYQGCPIPDTDGDGINDEEDKCPTVSGFAKYQGCPIPDTDGDGINDEEDKCPNVAGTAANFGCPDMTLYYKRAEATLSATDKLSLDSVVTFMNKNPDVKIIVQGYTSTLGAEAYNQTLSEKRAANSVKYMVSKGVDASRMKSVGFGETSPVEGTDQSTEAGRAANRRTVIQIDKE